MQDYNTLVSTVAGMSVTGVKRAYTHKPAAIHTADLPASFVELPGGAYQPVWTCHANNVTRTIRHVIAVEPIGQGTANQNYDLTVDLLDAVTTAIHAVDRSTWSGVLTYQITSTGIPIGDVFYWAIVTSITVQG